MISGKFILIRDVSFFITIKIKKFDQGGLPQRLRERSIICVSGTTAN